MDSVILFLLFFLFSVALDKLKVCSILRTFYSLSKSRNRTSKKKMPYKTGCFLIQIILTILTRELKQI